MTVLNSDFQYFVWYVDVQIYVHRRVKLHATTHVFDTHNIFKDIA